MLVTSDVQIKDLINDAYFTWGGLDHVRLAMYRYFDCVPGDTVFCAIDGMCDSIRDGQPIDAYEQFLAVRVEFC